MSRHGNISVFVPHIGCPHRCSFCDQHAITGHVTAPKEADIIAAVEAARWHPDYVPAETELAFFGGSFTAIDREYMLRLLQTGFDFVRQGAVSGIRVSTRPDAITPEILDLLQSHGVTAIELGCQSLSDEVLRINHRGHTAAQVHMAAALIQEKGISLGLQMMTGLPGDTEEQAIQTAKGIIALSADTVRIYPTVICKGTHLHRLYEAGEYQPQTLEQAVDLTARLLRLFAQSNTKVIRVGLHAVEQERLVAGPWHPAFGELCKSRLLLEQVKTILQREKIPCGSIEITLPKGCASAMIGQKKANIEILRKMGYNCKVIEAHINDIFVRSKNSAD